VFERILIPLDGSARAEAVLAQVGRILKRRDSEILLLRAVDVPVAMDSGRQIDLLDREREQAQKYIHELVRRFAEVGAKVHGRVVEGLPSRVIHETAQNEGSTLLAMSTHGRSGLSRWFMGSVAEKVLRTSEIPVLLFRSFRTGAGGKTEPAAATEVPFRKILVPTDGSPASMSVLGPATKFAQLFDSEILVLHVETPMILPGMEMGVVPLPLPTPSAEDPVPQKAVERFRQAGLRATPMTVLGEPAGEIVDQSYGAEVDLIAMATHGRTGFTRWLLGSVAERVLHHAGVPILLVRAEAPAKKEKTPRIKAMEGTPVDRYSRR